MSGSMPHGPMDITELLRGRLVVVDDGRGQSFRDR
jgi:hypothetical protein